MGDPLFQTPTDWKPLNRFRYNLLPVTTSATQPLIPNLGVVGSEGACPHIGEVLNPRVYFLAFDLFAHLPRAHRLS